MIPSSSIIQDQGENCVYVIEEQVAQRRMVAAGLSNEQNTHILTGLDEDEQVAVSNVHVLLDKTPVEVQ